MQHLKDGWVTSDDLRAECYWKNGKLFGSVEHMGEFWEVMWRKGVRGWAIEIVDPNAPADMVRSNVEIRASKYIV